MRIGGLLREEWEDGVWESVRRTHRGQVSLDNEDGCMDGGKKMVLQVMRTKVDQGNRNKMRKAFRVGERGEELSPGRAIVDFIRGIWSEEIRA